MPVAVLDHRSVEVAAEINLTPFCGVPADVGLITPSNTSATGLRYRDGVDDGRRRLSWTDLVRYRALEP